MEDGNKTMERLISYYNHFATAEDAYSAVGQIRSYIENFGCVTYSDILNILGAEYDSKVISRDLLNVTFRNPSDFGVEFHPDESRGRMYSIRILNQVSDPEPAVYVDIRKCCVGCHKAYWGVSAQFRGPRYSPNPDIDYADIYCKHNKVCAAYQSCKEQMVMAWEQVEPEEGEEE